MSNYYVPQWLCPIVMSIKGYVTSDLTQGLCWIVTFPNGFVTLIHSSSMTYVELIFLNGYVILQHSSRVMFPCDVP
jgi:hypothetical protein